MDNLEKPICPKCNSSVNIIELRTTFKCVFCDWIVKKNGQLTLDTFK